MIKNYSISAGDDFVLNLTFKTDLGVAIDITGWKIALAIKKFPGDPVSEAILSQVFVDFPDAETGKATISCGGAVTAPLLGNYYYEVKVKKDDVGEAPFKAMEGAICISDKMTEDFADE